MEYEITKIENIEEVKATLSLVIDAKKAKAKDKELIKTTAEALDYHLDIEGRSKCSSCWVDWATELLGIIKTVERKKDGGEHYILREGVNVKFGSIVVNEGTITDDLARELLSRGFDPNFFSTFGK